MGRCFATIVTFVTGLNLTQPLALKAVVVSFYTMKDFSV